jgi:hypothetical protein
MKWHNAIGHAWPPRRPPTMIQGGRQVTRAGEAANRGSLPRRAHSPARVSTTSTIPHGHHVHNAHNAHNAIPAIASAAQLLQGPPHWAQSAPLHHPSFAPLTRGRTATMRTLTAPTLIHPLTRSPIRSALAPHWARRGTPRMRILGAPGANHAHPSHALTWPLFTASLPQRQF